MFPRRWVKAAIAAAAIAFGPAEASPVTLHYVNLPGRYLAATDPPSRIAVDKRPRSDWPKWLAQCAIAHEAGHLAGRKHSRNPASIMYRKIGRSNCLPFLRRHGLRR